MQQESLDCNRENSILQRKLQDCEVSIEKYEQEKRELKDELVALHGKLTELEVNHDYEKRENDSMKRQLEDALQRVTSSREEFLENDKQLIEQRLGADAMKKEMEEKSLLTDQLKASKLYLEESIETLKHTLAASREDCERSKLEKGRLQQDILTLTSSNSEYETRIQKLSLERERIQLEYQASLARVSSLEQQLIEKDREKNALCGKMEEWKNNSLMHQESQVTADKHIADLEGMLNVLKTDAIKKEGEIKDLQTRKSNLENEADFFKKRAHKLELEYKELAEQNRNLESQKKSLLRLKNAEDSTAVLQEKVQTLEREVLACKRKIAELEANNQAMLAKQTELEDNISATRAESTSWESKCNVLQARKDEIEHDMLALQREYTPLKDDHHHSVFMLESAQGEMQEARNKVLKLEMEINKADHVQTQLELRVQEYKAMLKKRDEEVLSLQSNLQESRLLLEHKGLSTTDKDPAVESLASENNKLEKEVFALRQELNSTQSLLTAAMREKDEADKEGFALKRSVTELQAKLNSSQQQIQELQNSISACQRKITTSEEGQQKAIIEQVTLRSQLNEANKRVAYSKEGFFETQRELFSLRALVENYKKEVAKNDALIKEQSTRIKSQEDELRTSKLRIAGGRDEYESINQEVTRLKLQVEEKDRCIAETEHNARRLLQENSKFRFELSDCQALESAHKRNFNDSKHKVDSLQEEIISLRQRMSYLEAQNSAKEEELQENRKELLALKRTNFGFKSKYQALERQKRELQAELSMSKTKSSIINEHDELKSGAYSTFADRSTITVEAMNDSVSRRNSVLTKKNEEYSLEISRLENNVRELQSKLATESKEKEKLECDVLWRTRRIEDLERKILKDHTPDADLKGLNLKLAALEQELFASKETISQLEKCCDSGDEKLKANEEKLRLAEQKTFSIQSSYLTSQDRGDAQPNKLLEAQRRLCVIQATLEDDFQGHLRQEENLKRLVDEARRRNDDLRKEISRNENARRPSVTATSSLQIDIDLLKKDLAQYREDNHRLLTEKEDLNIQLQKLQLHISSSETSYSDVKRENDDLRFQLSSLQRSYSLLKDTSDNVKLETHFVSMRNGDSIAIQHSELEIQQLKDEKDRLNGEVASFKLLLSSYKEKLDLLHSEKVNLNDKLEASERTVFGLEQANKTLIAEKSQLEEQVYAITHKTSTTELDEFVRNKETGKMFELRIDLEKMTRERDYLQRLLDLARSRDDFDKCMQLERAHNQKMAEKDNFIDELRRETTTLQLEVGRLKQEQILSQTDSENLRKKYVEILNERDSLQRQCIEYRLKNENNTPFDTDSIRREINEKSVTIDKLRTETHKLQAEVDSTKKELVEKTFLSQRNNIEAERLREETNSLRTALANSVKENGTLKLTLDDICQERDFLFKNKCSLEYDLSVSQRKMSQAKNPALNGNSKKDQELSLVQSKFAKLESDFKEVKQENETMKLEIELKIKTEVWRKQECIFQLEKDMRKLKAENEYHQKVMEEKNANLGKLRSQILSWQKQAEKLEKELYVSQEAYEKCDRRMKEIFNSQHELLTLEDVRSLVSASPVISMRSISRCEHSITGRKLTEDNSLSLSSIRYSFYDN